MKGYIKKDCKRKEKKYINKKEKPKFTYTFINARMKKIQEIKKDQEDNKEINLITY